MAPDPARGLPDAGPPAPGDGPVPARAPWRHFPRRLDAQSPEPCSGNARSRGWPRAWRRAVGGCTSPRTLGGQPRPGWKAAAQRRAPWGRSGGGAAGPGSHGPRGHLGPRRGPETLVSGGPDGKLLQFSAVASPAFLDSDSASNLHPRKDDPEESISPGTHFA